MSKYPTRREISESDLIDLKEYSELMKELLFHRGIKTAEDAQEFLNPSYDDHVHDPFLLKDMDKAVRRVLSAIEKNEKIIIYSDYDCDGIPGGVVLHDFFKKIEYKNAGNFIPHRHEDGYGFHISAIERFARDGVDLVITVDCGITDIEAVDYANKLGIDVIITDHHLPPDDTRDLPDCLIVNPIIQNEKYPFKNLAGVGVAFKLAKAIIDSSTLDKELKTRLEERVLDLVAIGTIADCMKLLGENRVLVKFINYKRVSSRKIIFLFEVFFFF